MRHRLPRSTITATADIEHLALTEPGFDTIRADGRRWARAVSQQADDDDRGRQSETLYGVWHTI